MENGLSASDIAVMTHKDDDGFGGGNTLIWIFALLLLYGGGFGFGNGATNAATSNDIQRAVDLNAIQQGQANIMADVQRTNYEQIGAVKDAAYNNLSEIRDLQAAVNAGFANAQNCCCEIKGAIMENRYLDAQNTASINANTTAQVQKVLDALSTNRMADMQNQINQLQLANAVSGVVRYPMSTTYGAGNSCFATGCGCGNV